MSRLMMPALAWAMVVVTAGSADDKSAKSTNPTGYWTRSSGESKTVLQVLPSKVLSLSVRTKTGALLAEGGYTLSKDGVLKWKVNIVRRQGNFDGGLKQGDTLSLKYEVKDATLTFSDLKGKDGKDMPEALKTLLEGDYTKPQPGGGLKGKKQ
jgi:hypothetical protein